MVFCGSKSLFETWARISADKMLSATLQRFRWLHRSNALDAAAMERAIHASVPLDDGDDDVWMSVDADGSARPVSSAPPTEGRSSHHAVAPPDGSVLDAMSSTGDSPGGDHVAPPAPRRRQARNPPARPPASKPKRQTSSKWISCHIPAKFGGPTIHVLMPEALALTEWFNEDLKSCIFEYADAKSAGPPFQFVKAR